MTRVLIVDDHRMVRVGLASMIATAADLEVAGEAENGQQALDVLTSVGADVVLMDLSMPTVDGIEATRRIARSGAATRVVVLTSSGDKKLVRDAVAAGAVGYLLKDCAPEELISAIRAAAAGHAPLDPRVAGALLPATPAMERTAGLSDREIEVLRHTATGMANKQIARRLGISERTVKVHLGNVFRRIGVSDRTSAALWARDNLPSDN